MCLAGSQGFASLCDPSSAEGACEQEARRRDPVPPRTADRRRTEGRPRRRTRRDTPRCARWARSTRARKSAATCGARTSLGDFVGDLRYAARALRRSPGFAVLAIVIMALGIGANTAVFSVVNGVLLKPLPYPDADRIVTLRTRLSRRRASSQASSSIANFRDWRDQSSSFEAMASYRGGEIAGDAGRPRRSTGASPASMRSSSASSPSSRSSAARSRPKKPAPAAASRRRSSAMRTGKAASAATRASWSERFASATTPRPSSA